MWIRAANGSCLSGHKHAACPRSAPELARAISSFLGHSLCGHGVVTSMLVDALKRSALEICSDGRMASSDAWGMMSVS